MLPKTYFPSPSLSFPDLRLQLLDVENNPYLIKALYGLLMLLPQSQAFQLLSHRLRCVPNPELMRTVYVCNHPTKSRLSPKCILNTLYNVQWSACFGSTSIPSDSRSIPHHLYCGTDKVILALSGVSEVITHQNVLFIYFPRDGSKPCNNKCSNQAHVDYTELLQHFDRVQSKHLEVRHQRTGRAEHTDRKLALWDELSGVQGPECAASGPPVETF